MSGHLIFAAVTEALTALLGPAARGIPGAQVLHLRPDQAAGAGPAINLYLHRVSPSPQLMRRELPARDASGTLLLAHRHAMNLHYLLSFLGDDTTLEPQRLLGAAVAALDEHPVLTAADLTRLLANSGQSWAAGLDLSAQADPIRVQLAEPAGTGPVFALGDPMQRLSLALEVSGVVLVGTEPGAVLPV